MSSISVLTPKSPSLNEKVTSSPTPAAGQSFIQTVGTIPPTVLQGLNKAAFSFQQQRLSPTAAAPAAIAKQQLAQSEVDRLNQAEAMMQDAYAKASNPNANSVDKQQAEAEVADAEKIRMSVYPELSPGQQQALEQIDGREFDAVYMAAHNLAGNPIAPLYLGGQMQQAAQMSKSLDNWILSGE